jgi:endonuclease/exonuclease/phosphatase (EEP) superfamily protein YafD
VRLARGGWVVNLHASNEPPAQRRADLALAEATARAWAGAGPLVFGGDLNATRPAFAGWQHAARHHVDHIFAAGREPAGRWELLDAGALSDHRPLRVTLVGSGGA